MDSEARTREDTAGEAKNGEAAGPRNQEKPSGPPPTASRVSQAVLVGSCEGGTD